MQAFSVSVFYTFVKTEITQPFMAKNKIKSEPSEETGEKKKIKKKVAKAVPFYKSPKVHNITGLFLLVFSIFLLIAFSSYLTTWEQDADKITNIPFLKLLFDGKSVENLAGKIGAFISQIFILKGF